MNHIEKAYKAWRATVKDDAASPSIALMIMAARMGAHSHARGIIIGAKHSRQLTPSARARHAVKSYWATLTPEQRSERQRKAARKMWKRRKAERRA